MSSRKMKIRKSSRRRSTEDDGPRITPVRLLDRPRSWAIYGRSGTGKTTFASTFPKPALLIDVRDQGTDSVADVRQLDHAEVETWEDFEDLYYYLKENPKKYKTVIIDTMTQLQQVCLEYILRDKKKDAERVGDWGTMTRREWGDASGMLKDWIINFRNLPLEVVFLAQEKITANDDEDNDDSDNRIMPNVGSDVMKSVRSALNAAVSIIGNTFIKSRKIKKEVKGKKVIREDILYCLRIGPNPVYDTKIRKPKSVPPPPWIEDPEYKDVIEVIQGEE